MFEERRAECELNIHLEILAFALRLWISVPGFTFNFSMRNLGAPDLSEAKPGVGDLTVPARG